MQPLQGHEARSRPAGSKARTIEITISLTASGSQVFSAEVHISKRAFPSFLEMPISAREKKRTN